MVAGVPRMCMSTTPAPAAAAALARASSPRAVTSLMTHAPAARAWPATSALAVSTETTIPGSEARDSITGARRRICSAAGTGRDPGRVDSAPRSIRSAPAAASRRAWSAADAESRNRPPSENESGVTFTIPMTSVRVPRSNTRSRQRHSMGTAPPRACLLLLQRLAQPADLSGVVVGVHRVDVEPGLGGVEAVLGVPAGPLPVLVGHRAQDLTRGGPDGAELLECRGQVAQVVAQDDGIDVLVVAVDDRKLLGEQPPQAEGRDRLAVGQMVDDLARAPLAGDGVGDEPLARETRERLRHFVVAGRILCDLLLSAVLRHGLAPPGRAPEIVAGLLVDRMTSGW